MISPVFAQNMYQGVFEDLNPRDVPEDIGIFDINGEKYPLLKEVEEYVQSTELEKGDCVYIPNFWFYQWVSNKDNAIFMNF
jgi:hypothetical protein